ncbi:hypothetical protein [Dickeya lacustris]|uniref:Uncharacterized protein n=1 Tax=Dickeya lacustris TaxID=2259638 RepID=A0ABY8G6P0_9GAMM|nr:hypothetical protein [Dickeya lacustris]WFN55625.1 hypothetical protein O1Q98_18945 [Dickeya lacustris]
MKHVVRDKRCYFFAASSLARQGEVQAPPLLDLWLVAKLCRFAVPSAFAFAVRAARDVFPTRHGLSPHPCGSPGEVAHLSTVFDAEKRRRPGLNTFVSRLAAAGFICVSSAIVKSADSRITTLDILRNVRAFFLLKFFNSLKIKSLNHKPSFWHKPCFVYGDVSAALPST